MKTPITVRLDPGLLAAVRAGAVRENRSLTNFIETALRDRVGTLPSSDRSASNAPNAHENQTRMSHDDD